MSTTATGGGTPTGSNPAGVASPNSDQDSASSARTELRSVSTDENRRKPCPGDVIEVAFYSHELGTFWQRAKVTQVRRNNFDWEGIEPPVTAVQGTTGYDEDDWHWPVGSQAASDPGNPVLEAADQFNAEQAAQGEVPLCGDPGGSFGLTCTLERGHAGLHSSFMSGTAGVSWATAPAGGEVPSFQFDDRPCVYCGQLVAKGGGSEQPGGNLAHISCEMDAQGAGTSAPQPLAHGCTHLTPGCCADRKVCVHGVACMHGSVCHRCWLERCPESTPTQPEPRRCTAPITVPGETGDVEDECGAVLGRDLHCDVCGGGLCYQHCAGVDHFGGRFVSGGTSSIGVWKIVEVAVGRFRGHICRYASGKLQIVASGAGTTIDEVKKQIDWRLGQLEHAAKPDPTVKLNAAIFDLLAASQGRLPPAKRSELVIEVIEWFRSCNQQWDLLMPEIPATSAFDAIAQARNLHDRQVTELFSRLVGAL